MTSTAVPTVVSLDDVPKQGVFSLFKRRRKVQPRRPEELDQDVVTPLIYDCKETKPGVYEWNANNSYYLDALEHPSTSKAQIFLLEGISPLVTDAFTSSRLQLPLDFFSSHEKNIVPNLGARFEGGDGTFFAKWHRYVRQKNRHWEIERRIAAGRPYNLDTVTDPINLRLDHEWYGRIPRVYRSYDPIRRTISGDRDSAALECISFFWKQVGDGFVGVLVFDPVRRHKIVKMQYNLWGVEGKGSTEVVDCFVDDLDRRKRFMKDLQTCEQKSNLSSLKSTIEKLIIQTIFNDSITILASLNDALDEIDLSMSQDDILRRSLREWRNNFGCWRTGLQHQSASLMYIRRVLAQHTVDATSTKSNGAIELADVDGGLAAVQKRVDATFQVLMSTMSIIESQKAIAQAETVSKLTYLAFFFIPPTFVTGIFGMNIVEFVDKLKVWLWVTISLSVSILAYIFLFWQELFTTARQTPNILTLNRRRISATVAKWTRTGYFLIREVLPGLVGLVIVFGVVGGFAVGLWKLYTSHLSKGAKAGVTIGIFGSGLLPVMLFMMVRLRKA